MESGVYKAIVRVASDISKTGIAKKRTNVQQRYQFRGIDDVYNEVAPLLSKHGLCILPRVLKRECSERETKSGTPLFSVVVEMEFDFVYADDGSKHTVKTFGEAMDSADKATNKAMSAAYKYAAFQTFCIPTEGDNDADATTYDVVPEENTDYDDPHVEALREAGTEEEVKKAWEAIPVGERRKYVKEKDAAKARVFRQTG